MAGSVDGDLALFHRLQQGRLRLRGGSVDLVGEHDVGEQRARLEAELLGAALIHADPNEVCGQQVRCELHALPGAIDRRRHCLGQARLAHARDVLDQEVSFGEQTHHGQLDRLLLAVHHLGDVGGDRVEQRREACVAGRRGGAGAAGSLAGRCIHCGKGRPATSRSALGGCSTVVRYRRATMSWRGLPPPAAETAASAIYLAIDVGHDRLAAGIVNDYGEVLVRDRIATPARDVWPALQRLIRRVVAARPEDAGALVACGVTCEGPIDKDEGTVAPLHMPSLVGFTLRERVHELTRLPTVLATSAQARVLAERWIGAARGVADVMVLLVADAVEAGIVSNGRLLGGRRGNAGLIGHVNVEPNGLACVCGARGLPLGVRLRGRPPSRDQSSAAPGTSRGCRTHGRDDRASRRLGGGRLRPAPRAPGRQRPGDVRSAAPRGGEPRTRPAKSHRLPAQHAGSGAAAGPARNDDARSGVGTDRRRWAGQAGAAPSTPGEIVGGMTATWYAVAVAVLRNPALWPTAARQLRRTARRGWWWRPPFLPLPSADYVRFRLLTQYGDAADSDAGRRHQLPPVVPRLASVVTAADFALETIRGAVADFHAADLLADPRPRIVVCAADGGAWCSDPANRSTLSTSMPAVAQGSTS